MKNFETIINDFFNRNSFEAIELENLRNHIKSSLSHNEYKLYENIINLNLVKFKLSDIKSKNCSDLDHLNKTIESNHNILAA